MFVFKGMTLPYLIPERPKGGCPSRTYGCMDGDCTAQQKQNCFCEEHCSWQICRLDRGPDQCLEEVKSSWTWDSNKLYWVAQFGGISSDCVFKVSNISILMGVNASILRLQI